VVTVRRWIVSVLSISVCAAFAVPAHAAYHLMKIREVGSGASGDFVELQMHSSGQTQVQGHSVRTYGATGSLVSNVLLTGPVANGQNQRTVLVASTGSSLGVTPDATGSLEVPATGGSACFYDDPLMTGIDCVSWGGAAPPSGGGSPVGTPAAAFAEGQSLERTIAPGCATLLEDSDDTNNGSDFSVASQSPRPNSVTPTETACGGGSGGGGGGGGGGADNNPPNTTITKGPQKKSEKTKAKFKFDSNENGSSFQCKLDKGSYKKCSSPKKYKGLDEGKHKFSVRAIDRADNVDPSPAKYKFKVLD
jgi:hypothetical protein